MTNRWQRLGFVGGTGALLAACNAIWGIDLPNPNGGTDATSERAGDATIDQTTDRSIDARRDATAKDAEPDEMVADADAEPPPPETGSPGCLDAGIGDVKFTGHCPDGGLPKMIYLAQALADSGEMIQLCIDSTEVTHTQYESFLAAAGTPQMPCACGWKDGGVTHPTGGAGGLPIYGVDWCDAYAYCQWAGKHLCGALGGGPVPWMEVGTAVDEYFAACGGSFLDPYPYGGFSFAPDNCNVAGSDYMGIPQVETDLTNCAYEAKIYNLVGNVEEWLDSCDKNSGKDDPCAVAGGSYATPEAGAAATCNYREILTRGTLRDDVGFRCCWP
jgi:sulfatase modifying factor 1